MKNLRTILVVVVLLIGLMPCVHAHSHGSDAEFFSLAASPCECHSCDREPCSDHFETQLTLVPAAKSLASPSVESPFVFFPAETHLGIQPIIVSSSGHLVALRTVQLLI